MKHQVLPNGAVLLIEEEIEASYFPNPTVHPLGPPTLSGTTYTGDPVAHGSHSAAVLR
jgi:hypothetical protein